MSFIDSPLPYRYHEMAASIINNMVNASFVASRYAVQPPEATELYYDRISLTLGHIHALHSENLAKILQKLVTAPENPTELQLEEGVSKLDWDQDYNDPYELALDALDTVLANMSRQLAVPAYELDINEIKKYFDEINNPIEMEIS